MMTLGMAGVPWRYDQELQAYRIQPGFKFPAIEVTKGPKPDLPMAKVAKAKAAARKALADVETMGDALRDLFQALDDLDS